MKKLLLFLSILMFLQCKTSTGKQGAGDLAEIDISQNYPEREMYLQDIAQVEYIPLETNDNLLLGNTANIVYVSDNYIIVRNMREGDVFVFDGQGKSKFSFNNKGQSGTEYFVIYSMAFDEKAKEIYIADRFSASPKFLVYAEDGKFKRSFPFPADFLPRDMYSFDDETLLVYDEFGMSTDNYSNKPYMLISKKDGSIVESLDIFLSDRVSNRISIPIEVDGQPGIMPLTISIPNNRSDGKNFLIADWSSDTIYRFTPRKELLPVIIRNPSVQKNEPKIVISNELVCDKFIFLSKAVFDFEMAKRSRTIPSSNLVYDFKTGQLNEYKLINKDYESRGVGFITSITPANTGVYTIDVPQLFEANDAGNVKGALKQLLKTLDEDDNPVLVKVKFF